MGIMKHGVKAFAVGLLGMGIVCAGCAGPRAGNVAEVAAASQSEMARHFHVRRASTPRGVWVLLLPGASGLTIFDDKEHYFRAAAELNALGYDAIVIDYKAAYRAAPRPPELPTGGKIAWVVEQAVAWAHTSGTLQADQPVAIVAWSLGAEGLWPLLADGHRVSAIGLKAAAAYYPSNEDGVQLSTNTPLLLLTGEKDDVTEAKSIRSMVERAASPKVTLQVYPEAHHGFDVESIQTPRTVRLLPLIGPSATFGYDASAASEAKEALAAFLDASTRR